MPYFQIDPNEVYERDKEVFKGNHGCMITNGDFGQPNITNGNNSGNSTHQSMVRRSSVGQGGVGFGGGDGECVSNRKGAGGGPCRSFI